MPIEDDLSVSLPKLPPPNPARREAAIDAALRRFDGREEVARDRPGAPSLLWSARLRQPQFGVVLSVVIVAAIGLPAALIAIRDRSPAIVTSAPPRSGELPQAIPPRGNASSDTQRTPSAAPPIVQAPPAAPAASAPPSDRLPASDKLEAPKNDETSAANASLPPAAPAPPPPPPPPPAAQAVPVVAEGGATQGAASNLVVTGTRIASRERAVSKASRSADASSAKQALADEPDDAAYAAFVTRLQAAIRANDRTAVAKLISYPLRVNSNGASRFYANARSVERDFDRIFTPGVRQAILKQRPDKLFTRDIGAMIGDGEVWFDHSCLNAECTALGPVRIKAVNR